jgi:hypothetical protein
MTQVWHYFRSAACSRGDASAVLGGQRGRGGRLRDPGGEAAKCQLSCSHFSTLGDGDPAGEYASLLADLFDAIMSTFRWT